ncbi:MAG: UDP-N-acetylglucosamine 2-epimerase (non-hydrolyzing) [Bdellovibrionota bacterium]|nr:UDP-N-acetylglucosamine 2-epimerase (non-hydrolyzing) [Bdellovibrionota bacterium]
MKVAVVLGTRPEFIKLSSFLREAPKSFKVIPIHTGQHYDLNMSEGVIKELKLPKMKYHIKLPKTGFEKQLAKMSVDLGEIFKKEKPDYVLVQGDTNSAMMGALIGRRLGIEVIHVEAGCRSFDKRSPEEQNRKLIDSISDIYFCADRKSVDHLRNEGVTKKVFFSGSTVFDAAKWASMAKSDVLEKFKLKNESYVVATLHRAENMEDLTEFKQKIEFINQTAKLMPVVFPIHPRTKKFLKEKNIQLAKEVKVIPPQTYLPFIVILKNCRFVISDSGGIQEEAAFFNRPCLILRDATEWTRLVDIKKNFLIKKITKKTTQLVDKIINDDTFYRENRLIKAPGIGTGATNKIISKIKNG